jgi:hypothetical protein
MLPALVVIGIGARRRLWLPLPTILLWPLWLIGWAVWLVLAGLRVPWQKTLRIALVLGAHLSGLRVDVSSVDGKSIYVRMI